MTLSVAIVDTFGHCDAIDHSGATRFRQALQDALMSLIAASTLTQPIHDKESYGKLQSYTHQRR